MNKIKNIGIAMGVVLLVAVLFVVISAVTKKPQKAYDFTVATQNGNVISLFDNYQKRGSAVVFFDPETEGSTELLSRIIKNAGSVDVLALSVSKKPIDEQRKLLGADILALDKLCFECSEAIEKYNIGNPPVSYFIDSDGYVQSVYIGAMRDSSIEKSIRKISK